MTSRSSIGSSPASYSPISRTSPPTALPRERRSSALASSPAAVPRVPAPGGLISTSSPSTCRSSTSRPCVAASMSSCRRLRTAQLHRFRDVQRCPWVTVWGEGLEHADARRIYPDGIHEAVAAAFARSSATARRFAPRPSGLRARAPERRAGEHRRSPVVGPSRARGRERRRRRPGGPARARRDGPPPSTRATTRSRSSG